MTLSDCRKSITNGPRWSLAMQFPDGEFGCLDATTRVAEQIMVTQSAFVVGIYRRDQARHLQKDVARRDPAWRKAA